MIPHRTVAESFRHSGIGVHTGESALAIVESADFGAGLTFVRSDGRRLRASIDNVVASGGNTTLEGGDFRIATVEHLLAALYGAGITDAQVVVHGPEIPILDGSALPWSTSLRAAGIRSGPPAAVREIRQEIRVEGYGGWALAAPGTGSVCSVEVAYGPGHPDGSASVALDNGSFHDEVAWARTFVMERDIGPALAMGRGKGASIKNTVVYGPNGPCQPLRHADEAVKHKLLDLVGDLALLGSPFRGSVHVFKGSHSLHHELVRKLSALSLA